MRKKKNPPENLKKMQEDYVSQYIFTFEMLRQYPNVRSFILKAPLKRSFKDTVSDLLGKKK